MAGGVCTTPFSDPPKLGAVGSLCAGHNHPGLYIPDSFAAVGSQHRTPRVAPEHP